MKRTQLIQIRKGHRLYGYFADICFRSARLYNRANYIVRNYAAAVRDFSIMKPLNKNEMEVYTMVQKMLKDYRYPPDGTKWLNYYRLDHILKRSHDYDYYNLPSQSNQQVLKLLMRDYKSFFEALKVYQAKPELFTGRPKMPKYVDKKGMKTAVLTNQVGRIKDGRYLKFPQTKSMVNLGCVSVGASLSEVRIKPRGDVFELNVVYAVPEKGTEPPDSDSMALLAESLAQMTDISGLRVVSIDPGVGNFCAMTNNFGARPMLIKGGHMKSANQYYNKRLAELKSDAELCNKKKNTKRISRLHLKRDNIIKDAIHKTSRYIVRYCTENHVDLVVFGHNVYQKQSVNMGRANNQTFVQIPTEIFATLLGYKLAENGIQFLITEESYTSKADFLAGDGIPVYGVNDADAQFSGKRIKRGLYRHHDGTLSNADVNGSANIMRKVFPKVTRWDRGLVDSPYAVYIA